MCTRPFKAFVIPGARSVNGKRVFKFAGIDATTCPDIPEAKDFEILSCGTCKECRLKAAKEWSVRCCAEASLYPENYNWFLTLTYDNEHLPMAHWRDIVTGEYIASLPNLSKEDLQGFLDNIRSYFDYHFQHRGCRFFASGEFGETSGRSHYHVCLFNAPLELLNDWSLSKPYTTSDLGHPLYHSPKLDKIWGKGIVLFSMNTPDTAAYTARYTLKKAGQPGDSLLCTLRYRAKRDQRYRDLLNTVLSMRYNHKKYEFEMKKLKKFLRDFPALSEKYAKQLEKERRRLLINLRLTEVPKPEGQQVEFVAMSKKPGLGKDYFMQHPDEIYLMNEIWCTGKKCSVPKYFKGLYESYDSELYNFEKERRHIDNLNGRQMQEFDFKITSWQHDVVDLKRSLVDSISKVYKRGDF